MSKYHVPLMPNAIYHLFSRAIGNEKLFFSNENYYYFLQLLAKYILPVVDILAYSLLPNHFHLLIKIKDQEQIQAYYSQLKQVKEPLTEKQVSKFIMQQFSNWLNAYAKAFNKKYNRKGALFIDYIKRSEAKTDNDITAFILYVHKNAVHYGYAGKIGDWYFDSYQAIIGNKPTLLNRAFCIDWFGGINPFILFHQQPIELKNISVADL